ncbi:MAG TPA: FAD-dependent oxidoreductase, partial [Streptosporangiaceae bacterium]|nr:FAD-dependent oxidoreductase [Streptosporangiaceae bacterium]
MRRCDVVVVGQGIFGLAAHACLASRGVHVIALERASPGHDGASSHGDSRVTRRANFENPAYTPLFDRSAELWRQLERAPGEIYLPTGVLECGPPGHALIAGTLAAAAAAGTAPNVMTPARVRAAFPAITLPADWIGVLQHDGGLIRADRAIARYLDRLAAQGAAPELGRLALAVEETQDGVEVIVEGGDILRAKAAIVATGPWIGDLVPELTPRLRLTRQVVGWFAPARRRLFAPDQFPVFLFATDAGAIYGFPDFAGAGVKIACHEHGRPLDHADLAMQDATAADLAPVRAAIAAILPDLADAA